MLNRQALERVINGTPQERIYLCGQDFSLFLAYYFVHYIKYEFAEFHFDMFQDLLDLVAGVLRECVWAMFRESAKTAIAKAFIIWLIAYRKRYYINVDAFDKENAERVLFDVVLELQTNPRLIQDFGQLFNSERNPDEIQQKRVNNFVTNNKIRVEAHSTQESVRGRLHGAQRPDCLILDDFETMKTADSKAYTEQVIGHVDEFKGGLASDAFILYLCNYITEYGSVNSLKLRAKDDPRLRYRQVDVMDSKEVPTWPAKYARTDEQAKMEGKVSIEDKIRMLGRQVFNREMMNMPIDEQTQEFKKDWFKTISLEAVLAKGVRKFVTIDPAFTKREESDYTGVVKNYVDQDDNWHLDGQHFHLNSTDLLGLIFSLHAEGFEKIGIEEGAWTHIIEPYFIQECQKRRVYPMVVPLKHGGVMKETRIRGLIPRYEQGKMFHIEGKCGALEDELLRFPKGKNDDVADAAQYQNKIAEPYIPNDEEFGLYKGNFSSTDGLRER